jgi:peptide/nickel transport system substrate-binding protein
MLFGEPKPKYVLYYYYGDETNKIIAQANHNLDMVASLSLEGFKALTQRNPYSRGYRKEYPWVFNGDPNIQGFTFNTDVYPYNIKDVRWALTLAFDIVDYIGMAYDGVATMGTLHLPPTPYYQKVYYEPMEEWLKNFTLDIEVNGEPFKPYDPDAPLRLAEYGRSRGYDVPDDPEKIGESFGSGWWKYAPDVAEQLLKRNGFTRDKKGKWLLPDGTPWKINYLVGEDPTAANVAAAQQWRNFGIEVVTITSEISTDLVSLGKFELTPSNAMQEPWGGHPDLSRSFSSLHSKYYKPIGEYAVVLNGPATGRWTDPRIDEIVEEMEKLDWNDPRNTELGMEGLKILIEEMPTIPVVGRPQMAAWDEYYWTNYPGAENPYMIISEDWPNFKYVLPFLEPTGRK